MRVTDVRKPKPSQITAQTLKIEEFARSGARCVMIAKTLGISHAAVSSVLCRARREGRLPSKLPLSATIEIDEGLSRNCQIEALSIAGMRNLAIARQLGVTPGVVAGVLDRARRRGCAKSEAQFWREVDNRPLTSTFASRMNELHRKLDALPGVRPWRPIFSSLPIVPVSEASARLI